MSNSGEAAEQVVRMSLNGIEIAAKISGKAAERLAVLLYAVIKDQKRTKGKIRLTNMLKSGKELKVFAVQDSELEKFSRAAKQYGVLYCMLKDRKDNSGMTDIMARADDASKINRIFERFNLATVDMASVKTEIEKTRTDLSKQEGVMGVPERNDQVKDSVDEFMKKIVPTENPNKEKSDTENPLSARTTKSHLSGHSSVDNRKGRNVDMQKRTGAVRSSEEERRLGIRPSVRKEMDEIRREQRSGRPAGNRERVRQQQVLMHKTPRRKRTGRERS